ncbi:DNA polymerase III subunit delta' [Alphaproteobacteria bacterium]|nr:DNA polymerase III subunit delta' [Alphaproteobacteria bacterium]
MDLFGVPERPDEPDEFAGSYVPDEVEDYLKHPREMTFCMGHEKFEAQILEAFAAGKMPHSIVLSGPKGCGKSTMAYRLGRFLLANGDFNPGQGGLFGDEPDFSSLDVARDHDAFRLIASEGHPDLFAVERQYDATKNKFKNAVDVEEIRKIAPFLRKTASYGGWRVVIVDDADTMTRSAQNAILKILEEPPSRVLIVLVTHNIGALIPTIRSRVQVFHLQALEDDVMRELLVKDGQGDIEKLVELSEGSMSKAMEYAESGATEILQTILSQGGDVRWSEIHKIADQIGGRGQDEDFAIFARLSLWIYEQGAKTKARGRDLPGVLGAARERFGQLSLEQILKICDTLSEHFTKTKSANLDKRQAVLQAFSIMAG